MTEPATNGRALAGRDGPDPTEVPAGAATATTLDGPVGRFSLSVRFHYRPGLFLATHYLRRHSVPVIETPLEHLPRLSRTVIRFALWVFPRFLGRADMTLPIVVAGRGWYQIPWTDATGSPGRSGPAGGRCRPYAFPGCSRSRP